MANPNDIVIISGARTPFSKFGGALRLMHSTELGAAIIREVLKRSGLKGSDIDEVYYGMCIQSEAALKYNVAGRQALIHAGLPPETVSLTVDRACCSSLACLQLGRRSLLLDESRVCMAVGAENMSNTPVVLNGHRWGTGYGKPEMVDHLNPIMYVGFNSLAADAGEVALDYQVTREMQDLWAYSSQARYQDAKAAGKFKPGQELAALELPSKKGPPVLFEEDEFPKPGTTPEGLARLGTVNGSPTVTAGNAPGLDAGASAIIITKRSTAQALGVKPLGVILSIANVASAPRRIAEVPAFAITKALDQAGLVLNDLDLLEINEAFAAMPLVSTKILANGDQTAWDRLLERTNVNGGAIALGHPVGASGARIILTALYELRRRGGGVAAAGICGGLAQGDAAIIRVDETCF